MSEQARDFGRDVLSVYDRALPEVYGYLMYRVGDKGVAEDLTSETFLAAITAARAGQAERVSVPWLIGVARHKLVDHWRRRAREERALSLLSDPETEVVAWEEPLELDRAMEVLRDLAEHHRTPLALRYVDELSVPEVAALIGRTVHATEALLIRAKAAFRRMYEEGGGDAV